MLELHARPISVISPSVRRYLMSWGIGVSLEVVAELSYPPLYTMTL